MKIALYYKSVNSDIECLLCPNFCKIKPQKTGVCLARKNINGNLYSNVYGKTTSINLDPIEKKPLYHFHPGKQILSIGTYGCNLKCPWCQNWSISQQVTQTRDITPEDILQLAKKYKNNIGVAYTYNEPFIWYEFVLECAKLIKENKLCNVLVTNGFVNQEPAENLLRYIDAINLDIKSFDDKFYKDYCKGDLQAVLNFAKCAKKYCHLEITNLIIPTKNDKLQDIEKLVDWIYNNLGEETPLHFSRYFPNYKMQDILPTPVDILKKAKEIADKKLKYVYLGNV